MNTILTSTSGGLDARAVEPFFASLRLSGYRDAVVVFAAHVSDDCRAMMRSYQADVIDFDYRGMPTLRSLAARLQHGARMVGKYYRRRRAGENETNYLFFNNARFFCYQDYLKGLKEKPGFVLLADIRDIVFQSDPFSFPFERGLSVATECVSRRIMQSWCAIKGMAESVGAVETLRMARRNIICAGTTVADYETMMAYLEWMTASMRRRFFWGLLEGIDQGLHTALVHRRRITPTHRYVNWRGPFLTMDSEVVLPKNKNGEGYLCNDDGTVVPIVHQYDRVAALYRPGEARPACWKLYHEN